MKKTLRDEIAMSMNHKSIPIIQDKDTMIRLAKIFNINFDPEDDLSMIDFALHYESEIRYKYAKAMIERRYKH